MNDKILLVGATGLTGGLFIAQAIANGSDSRLHILSRRAPDGPTGDATLHIADSAGWPDAIAKIAPAVIVSCLGSTIKKAGSQAAFAAIDRDLLAAVARAGRAAGTMHFLTVSSLMADSSASSFYMRTKGEAEDALAACSFDRLDILRPGLLIGIRPADSRPAERLAILFSPLTDRLLLGPLARYRSTNATDVAAALHRLIGETTPGRFVHEGRAIRG